MSFSIHEPSDETLIRGMTFSGKVQNNDGTWITLSEKIYPTIGVKDLVTGTITFDFALYDVKTRLPKT